MRPLSILLFFILRWNPLLSQTAVFKEFDFNKGGYSLVGMHSESDPNPLADSIGRYFYTNDISVLNEFKKAWVFSTPGRHYACGDHYIIHLCKNGKNVKEFAVNLNCNEIVCGEEYFYFDNQKLRIFKDKLKKPFIDKKRFNSLQEGRSYYDSIKDNTDIVFLEEPEWYKYEGRFDFEYRCSSDIKDCYHEGDKIKEEVSSLIRSTYPGEAFELSQNGGSLKNVLFEIYCNKSLSDKFSIYYKWGSWESYDLGLRAFWIKKPGS